MLSEGLHSAPNEVLCLQANNNTLSEVWTWNWEHMYVHCKLSELRLKQNCLTILHIDTSLAESTLSILTTTTHSYLPHSSSYQAQSLSHSISLLFSLLAYLSVLAVLIIMSLAYLY